MLSNQIIRSSSRNHFAKVIARNINVLPREGKLYELRQYDVKPEDVPNYIKLTEEKSKFSVTSLSMINQLEKLIYFHSSFANGSFTIDWLFSMSIWQSERICSFVGVRISCASQQSSSRSCK